MNFLWIMVDEMRADALSMLGGKYIDTPALERLSQRGTLFTDAYTPSPVCVPARAAIITGKACSSVGVLNNHNWLDIENVDAQYLPRLFEKAGYSVASFGKQHYGNKGAFPIEKGIVLGDKLDYFGMKDGDDEKYNILKCGGTPWVLAGEYPGSVEETPEYYNCCEAINYISNRDKEKPFFVRVSLNAPHTPVAAPKPFCDLVDENSIVLPQRDESAYLDFEKEYFHERAGLHHFGEKEMKKAIASYYGECAFVDSMVSMLLDYLDKEGLTENTVVSFISDHGTMLGEKDFYQKQSFYQPSVQVPFIISHPDFKANSVTQAVNIGSLLPTLCEFASISLPYKPDFPSLVPFMLGKEKTGEPVFSEIDYGLASYRTGERRVMIRKGEWKCELFRNPFGKDSDKEEIRLTNLEESPDERVNLATDNSCKEIISQMKAYIDEFDRKRKISSPRLIGNKEHLKDFYKEWDEKDEA